MSNASQESDKKPVKRQKLAEMNSQEELSRAALTPGATSIDPTEPQQGSIEHWAAHIPGPFESSSLRDPPAMTDQAATDLAVVPKSAEGQSPGSNAVPVDSSPSRVQTEKTSYSMKIHCNDYNFADILVYHDSYMLEHQRGCSEKSEEMLVKLLDRDVALPQDRIYMNSRYYGKLLASLEFAGQPMLVSYLLKALIPPAEDLGIDHADDTEKSKIFVQTEEEEWKSCERLHRLPRPEPSYSVGFQLSAFTESQQALLHKYSRSGEIDSPSPFKARATMLFPFMSCQIVGCQGTLHYTTNCNALSMTVALKGLCELFELAGMTEYIEGTILGFAFAFDTRVLEITGHYPRANADGKMEFYRRRIKRILLDDDDYANRWVSYRFAKGLWDDWAPNHLKKIQEAVDKLPSFKSVEDASG